MSQPVVTPPPGAVVFLVAAMGPGDEGTARDGFQDPAGATRSAAFRSSGDGLTCVVGVGPDLRDRRVDGPRPRERSSYRSAGTLRRAAEASHSRLP